MGDGFAAAAVVFVIGLVFTAAAMAVNERGRSGLATVVRRIRDHADPWWIVIGGVVGAVFVIGQGLVASVLGTAVFSIATVAGQTIGGLVADRAGIGPAGRQGWTTQRLIGSGLALVAAAWAVSSDIGGDFPALALLLPLVGGFALGLQQALNGRVRAAADSALTPAFVNFLGGAVVTVAAAAVHALVVFRLPQLPTQWWLYAGGFTSVVFIAATAVLVRRTGVLLLGIGTTAGQLLASLVLDWLLPQAGRSVQWTTFAGTALAVVAVLVVSIPVRGSTRPAEQRPLDASAER
jgi:bacterial/archaeal transporter family-2 protein